MAGRGRDRQQRDGLERSNVTSSMCVIMLRCLPLVGWECQTRSDLNNKRKGSGPAAVPARTRQVLGKAWCGCCKIAMTELVHLQERIEALEKAYYRPECADEQVRRARNDVEIRHRIYSAVWKWVPSDYYGWDLSQRAQCLGAPSIQHLCKSLLMENTKRPGTFVLVTNYDFRIADAADNDRITGYRHNSVTPFGMLSSSGCDEVVPIVLAAPIVALKFFWMGGGHVNLKLGMAVSDFCKALHPIVADISQPKSGIGVVSEDDLS
jgi:hypothetical protein